MATDYPQSTFIGIDIADGFPEVFTVALEIQRNEILDKFRNLFN